MPSIAIVIPNFNQSRFLSSALESLKFQSAKFTLAVMDGGSTDNFDLVVKKYSSIINYMRSGPDGGQAAAIFEGKSKIPGDIVCWLNADDYYFPYALDKVSACFEKYPELDVVYGNAIHVNPDGFFLSYFPPAQEFDEREITKNCFICQPACFVRRSAYEKAGGVNPNLQFTMDWDLWCRLSAMGAKFYYLPEVLAAVRYYPDTKTLSGGKRRYREIYRIEKKYGRRFLRISFLGGLYYSLTFKDKMSLAEKIFFHFFKILTQLKNHYTMIFYPRDPSNMLLYGFHRWQPIVEGTCTIHIPWYDRREWHQLRLRVEPHAENFEVTINEKRCDNLFLEEDYLVCDVPILQGPYRTVRISNLRNHRFRLLEFSCNLDATSRPVAGS